MLLHDGGVHSKQTNDDELRNLFFILCFFAMIFGKMLFATFPLSAYVGR